MSLSSVHLRLTITGNFSENAFDAFAHHYVARLDLDGGISRRQRNCVEISVDGPGELIDMLEIACWLGPPDAVVQDIAVTEVAAKVARNPS